ncbi:MAG TPA: indole-3-glycerol phosphate synthase TrpC [Flavobacterium sp.]|uniref:indole-3-glycerol phosphate synthase TrpC n=1 Tax=unclassified Flavobacterium TaxID=196869 RepID=UPI000E894281|nr:MULTISPECIES: indole-3-glycerol phosphate synthase TrpC [unclassified Flavobacterium]HBI00903.1 indole-3-glycerol phosphate synthase TrpC [Flavobacterium sp.]HRE78919.1 indole-3-glycerol phosphate synthase TrpC [Flavobacterium sp.]
MNILDQIIASKKREVELKKSIIPIKQLEQSVLFKRKTNSLVHRLLNNSSGIIAEHKRRSPSKSVINQSDAVEDIVKSYDNGGSSGISILTDNQYFGGSLDDLILARATTNLPLLRKDFLVDEFQIIEAKAFGADVILLIAAVLTREEIKQFSELAKSLNLEVLLEIHNQEELNKSIMPTLDLIGVNNRNLKTFDVNLEYSKQLAEHIPSGFIKISESGIDSTEAILELKEYGFKGFLMGEYFMKSENPESEMKKFINKIKI